MTAMIPTIESSPRMHLPYRQHKESKLKLSLEISESDGVTLVHCKGRITYRNEAAELSATVGALLSRTRYLVLDLSGVERIDSAGLGELVVLYMQTRACHCAFKLAAPRPEIWELLQLTNLTSVLEVGATVEEAIVSFRDRVA